MTDFGLYVGNNPDQLQAAENWLGRDVDHVVSYFNQSSWTAFNDSLAYGTNLWKGQRINDVIWGVPLVVTGSSLEQGASGAFNTHYLDAAKAIVASRSDSDPIYVRLGWEFNGDWMPWAAKGHEAAFIQTFRQAVDQFRSVSDRFKFVWDVNIGGGNMDPATAYPGDSYVDVVGADLYYNTAWDSTDPIKAFDYSVNRDYGLAWQQSFAAAHNKPTAISEWGVQSNGAGPFIAQMQNWFTQNNMLFANYWNSDVDFQGRLDSGQYPDAGQAFKNLFGQTTGSNTLSLKVSADSYQGDPQFLVYVDGQQIGGVQTAHASHAAGLSDTLLITGNFSASAKNVAVQFINDAWGGQAGLDRNLYVEGVSINGRQVAGDSAVSNTGGSTGQGTAILGSNGTATYRVDGGANTLSLKVAADSYQGDPQFLVFVDGQQAGGIQTAHASHAAGLSDTLLITGDFSTSAKSVAVQFINDAWGGKAGLDRNLYVEGVSINGRQLAGDSAVSNTGGTIGGGEAVLGMNGTATYRVDGGANTLSLKVAADSYQGDPQFLVFVDGQQIGGLQTAHASRAAGLADTLLITGDFSTSAKSVAVQFVNDAWGGRPDLDRNLYVEGVGINGRQLAGDSALSNTGGTIGGGMAVLGMNGTATYAVGA